MQSIPQSTPVSIDILRHALDLHASGQMAAAEQIYRDVLSQHPMQPVALHYLGICLHQRGLHEEAIDLIRLSCSLQSDNADWCNALGNVMFALQRFAEASEAYQAALQLDAGDHEVWNNLGSSQLQQGESLAAMVSFEMALAIDPDFAPALLHMSSILQAAGQTVEAVKFQCRAYVLPPHDDKPKKMLGVCFYFLGRYQEAAAIYRAWMEEEPGNPIASHLYAASAQTSIPERASDAYVEAYFDDYAATFDAQLLDGLAYRGPQLIAAALRSLPAPALQYAVLDIGCGTGLCGAVLAPYASRLTGVDLSAGMLAKAGEQGHYHALVKDEICSFMSGKSAVYDLIVAADTMIYFGDLLPVLAAVSQALRPGGWFIFTLECSDDDNLPESGHQLHASGRYRHRREYVERLLREVDCPLLQLSAETLREEVRQPVAGMLVIARRAPAPV